MSTPVKSLPPGRELVAWRQPGVLLILALILGWQQTAVATQTENLAPAELQRQQGIVYLRQGDLQSAR